MRKILPILLILLFSISCGKEEKTKNTEKNIEVSVENSTQNEKESIQKEEQEVKEEGQEILEEVVELTNENLEEKEEKKEAYFVSRSRVSYLVENREPLEERKEFSLNDRAYLFTEFMNIGEEVRTIKHKWYHIDSEGNKELTAEISLDIRGKRWRTWSSKKLYLKGSWQVEVEDEKGNIIMAEELQVI